jgi:hypothetical protein
VRACVEERVSQWLSARSIHSSKGGVAMTSGSQTPSSRLRGGPISKHIHVFERTKIWSWVLQGPKTKNDCAGEDH